MKEKLRPDLRDDIATRLNDTIIFRFRASVRTWNSHKPRGECDCESGRSSAALQSAHGHFARDPVILVSSTNLT